MISNIVLLAALAFNCVFAQPSLDDCGKTFGCFTDPSGCSKEQCNYIYKWSNEADTTTFQIAAKLNGTELGSWLAIGFSFDGGMPDTCAVICQFVPTMPELSSINHYHIANKSSTGIFLLDENKPDVGIDNTKFSSENGYLTCEFSRQKRNANVKNYYSLDQKYYLLAANGLVNINTSRIMKHYRRIPSSELIDFTKVKNSSNVVQSKWYLTALCVGLMSLMKQYLE